MVLNVDTLRIQLAAETAARQAAEARLRAALSGEQHMSNTLDYYKQAQQETARADAAEARIRDLEQQLVTLREQRDAAVRAAREANIIVSRMRLSLGKSE